jgi:hypothetical protein
VTPIEYRLRVRIDELVDERDRLRRLLEQARRRGRIASDQRRRAEYWKHRALRNTGLRK